MDIDLDTSSQSEADHASYGTASCVEHIDDDPAAPTDSNSESERSSNASWSPVCLVS